MCVIYFVKHTQARHVTVQRRARNISRFRHEMLAVLEQFGLVYRSQTHMCLQVILLKKL